MTPIITSSSQTTPTSSTSRNGTRSKVTSGRYWFKYKYKIKFNSNTFMQIEIYI